MKPGTTVTPASTWWLLTVFVLVTDLMTLPTLFKTDRPETFRFITAAVVLLGISGLLVESRDYRPRWWMIPLEASTIFLAGLSLDVPEIAKGILFAVVSRRGVVSNSRLAVVIAVSANAIAYFTAFTIVRYMFDDDRVSYLQSIVSVPSLIVTPMAMRLLVEGLHARAAAERTMATARDQLRKQALHDSLTGLANRTLFADETDIALRQAAGGTRPTSVLLLDLDAFKTINDTFGHATGDALLVRVARRISANLPPQATLARLGGDEFAVLLPGTGQAAAVAVAKNVLSAFEHPICLVTLDGPAMDGLRQGRGASTQVRVRVSIGAVVTDRQEVKDAGALLRAADLAMYAAKRSGGNRWAVFEPSMQDQLRERVYLEDALRNAVTNAELAVHYQPCVDLATGQINSAEALLRWTDSDRAQIAPQRFIPIAEDTGMIIPIGRWTMGEACRQAAAWEKITGRPIDVAVNLSVRQLTDPNLDSDLTDALTAAGIPADRLVMELTESELADDTVLPILNRLKAIGVRLALDDFGTGYSSLAYLRRFPLDILKIDQAFVAPITWDPTAAALTKSIIEMAHTLGLATVAEGIETAEQAEVLRAMRCQYAQGFFFARPGPPDAIAATILGPVSELTDKVDPRQDPDKDHRS